MRPDAGARVAVIGFGLRGAAIRSRVVGPDTAERPAAISTLSEIASEYGRPDLRILSLDAGGLAAGTYWLEVAVERSAATPGDEQVARSRFRVPS